MTRSSWNPSSPDNLGLEFVGVNNTSVIINRAQNRQVLRFTAQRTGPIDEIALYSGPATNIPALGSIFAGRQFPFIVELIPVTGYDVGGEHTITRYGSDITGSINAVDENLTTFEGNELTAPNDGLFAIQANGPASVAVHIPDASTFPTDQHITGIAVEHKASRQMRYRRIDPINGTTWSKVFPAGLATAGAGVGNHMGEAYIEAGDTGQWKLWTPGDLREFDDATGQLRRLQVASLNPNGNPTIDLLRIHVDHIPERRAGVGVIDTDVVEDWVTVPFHAPNATGSPAHITAGGEYVLVVRYPGAFNDYGQDGQFDWHALGDPVIDGSFVHFSGIDWTRHEMINYDAVATQGLGAVLPGLPAARLLNSGAQTVDTQPYERRVDGHVSIVSSPTLVGLSVDDTTVEYGQVQVICVAPEFDVAENSPLELTVRESGVGTLVAGPIQITRSDYDDGTPVGTTAGTDYRLIRKTFTGTTFPSSVDVEFRSTALDPWLVADLVAATGPGSGDQTFPGTVTGGSAFDPFDLEVKNLSEYDHNDFEVMFISQPPTITGAVVDVLQQPVTGGSCEPCGPQGHLGCTVLSIPYPRFCWSHSDLLLERFAGYEVQRREGSGAWQTVDVITPTGAPEFAVDGDGNNVNANFGNDQHVAPSVVAATDDELLICAWMTHIDAGNYTPPGSMTLHAETDATFGVTESTMMDAYEVISADGPTGPRVATFTDASEDYASLSLLVEGDGAPPVIEESFDDVADSADITFNTDPSTERNWWLIAIAARDGNRYGNNNERLPLDPPSGDDWTEVATSLPAVGPILLGNPNVTAWAKRIRSDGVQTVTFPWNADPNAQGDDWHARLYVLSNVNNIFVTGAGIPNCYDDWVTPYGVEACYRVRQFRVDGAASEWSTPVCVMPDADGTGADVIITSPHDPTLNVAFPEAHGGRLPVERQWRELDADQVIFRPVYERDYQLAFRPIERTGITFERRLLVAALCTPVAPCLDVVQGIRTIATAQVPYLVVRDTCGNRWYAAVQVPLLTEMTDPDVGSIWLVDVQVTQLVTPIIEAGLGV